MKNKVKERKLIKFKEWRWLTLEERIDELREQQREIIKAANKR